ncbi:ABC transporter ATP-binding protein [Marinobacter psychrophilus]|jgi:putative ABC transport system ATP-binding protein|uniref:ABC transporter ATP-binding protein n=1 Tax=Marinobacter psychrophilus TaxID=330734 RepID=UPI001B451109|nr:ABC transporter ATP-binding protein [Marinobacter psychrophilus]MBQ0764331.1 ABC transporter ATP-binding protein [Marinobacter psychrophilus]MBQ0845111.1 ABC transporter ATP-binding protein [Marinobacter psychrophilus]
MTKTTATMITPDSDSASAPLALPSLQIRELTFRWQSRQPALTFPDITLDAGDHLFLRGASGSGKSTLLGLLAGLNSADNGEIRLLGKSIGALAPSARDRFRADHIGVIFQQFNLVPYLTALANVILPCQLSPVRRDRISSGTRTSDTRAAIHAKAKMLLTALSIPQELHSRKPAQLSIGQQQRVAAARALMGAPELILADEPTSALDSNNRDRFMQLLLEMAQQNKTSVVFVSHDPALAHHFHHQIELEQPSWLSS